MSTACHPLLGYLCLAACSSWVGKQRRLGNFAAWSTQCKSPPCLRPWSQRHRPQQVDSSPRPSGCFPQCWNHLYYWSRMGQGQVLPCCVLSHTSGKASSMFMTSGNTIPSFPLRQMPAVAALRRITAGLRTHWAIVLENKELGQNTVKWFGLYQQTLPPHPIPTHLTRGPHHLIHQQYKSLIVGFLWRHNTAYLLFFSSLFASVYSVLLVYFHT